MQELGSRNLEREDHMSLPWAGAAFKVVYGFFVGLFIFCSSGD
jgi:hypothetical protein